jgi:hypothetical protein
MGFCPVCSRKVDDNAIVCPNCNAELKMGNVNKEHHTYGGETDEEWGNGTIYVDVNGNNNNYDDIDDNKWGNGTVYVDQSDYPYFASRNVGDRRVNDEVRPKQNHSPAPGSYQVPSSNMSIKNESKKKDKKTVKEKEVVKEKKIPTEKKVDTVTLVVRIILIAVIVIALGLGIVSMLI